MTDQKNLPNSFPHPSNSLRNLVLFIIFFTGFSGLVYEVTWHRYLANLIGSQAKAAAIILAVFLGGLCLGYVLFGRYSPGKSPRNLIKTCGWAEVGIGVWAFLFPNIYQFFWKYIGILDPFYWAAIIPDTLTCVLLMGLPTILMGGTLPLLTQGLSKNLSDSSTFHAKVYSINTAGAFFGCIIAGFVLIPKWGLPFSILAMGVINITSGVFLVGLGKFLPSEISLCSKAKNAPKVFLMETDLSLKKGSVLAFLAGFYALSLQTVLMRVVGLSLGASEYSFSVIVAVYILMLALGAGLLTRKSPPNKFLMINQMVVFLGILITYCLIPLWPYGFHVLRTYFSDVEQNFFWFTASSFVILALLLAIPVGAMGITMPMLFHRVKIRLDQIGMDVGKLYGWNTLGCICGALLGGFVFLFFLNLDQIVKISLLAISITVILLMPRTMVLKRKTIPIASLVAFGVLIILLFLPQWNRRYLAFGIFRYPKATPFTFEGPKAVFQTFFKNLIIRDYRDGPNTTVAITESRKSVWSFGDPDKTQANRFLMVNGKPDGGTDVSDLRTVRLLGHLPALFHSSEEKVRAAVIGFGTGITIGSLSLYPNISEIDVIEISPVVKRFAPYFEFANHQILKNPKMKWQLADAYRFLGSSSDPYSIIVSEPSNPWVAGVDRLYTQEFYQLLSEKMTDDGIFAQWFHIYLISLDTAGMVINTIASVFPHVYTFKMHTGNTGDLIFIATKKPLDHKNFAFLNAQINIPPIHKELNEIGIDSVPHLLSLEMWLPPRLFKDRGIHSLEFPKLSYDAGKDFFFSRNANLENFLSSPLIRPSSQKYSRNILLKKWLDKFPQDSWQILQSFIEMECGKEKIHWEKTSLRCQKALVAQHVAYRSDFPVGLSQNEIQLLKEVLIDSHGGNPLNSKEATLLLKNVIQYESIFLPLSIPRILERTRPCLEKPDPDSMECQKLLNRFLPSSRL